MGDMENIWRGHGEKMEGWRGHENMIRRKGGGMIICS